MGSFKGNKKTTNFAAVWIIKQDSLIFEKLLIQHFPCSISNLDICDCFHLLLNKILSYFEEKRQFSLPKMITLYLLCFGNAKIFLEQPKI